MYTYTWIQACRTWTHVIVCFGGWQENECTAKTKSANLHVLQHVYTYVPRNLLIYTISKLCSTFRRSKCVHHFKIAQSISRWCTCTRIPQPVSLRQLASLSSLVCYTLFIEVGRERYQSQRYSSLCISAVSQINTCTWSGYGRVSSRSRITLEWWPRAQSKTIATRT